MKHGGWNWQTYLLVAVLLFLALMAYELQITYTAKALFDSSSLHNDASPEFWYQQYYKAEADAKRNTITIEELTSIEWSAPNVIVLAVGVLLALFVGCVAIVRTATPPP